MEVQQPLLQGTAILLKLYQPNQWEPELESTYFNCPFTKLLAWLKGKMQSAATTEKFTYKAVPGRTVQEALAAYEKLRSVPMEQWNKKIAPDIRVCVNGRILTNAKAKWASEMAALNK